MKFGIHNSSWLDRPDPAEAFSVMDHMIQIPRVGAPDEPVLEGWTVLAGLAAVTGRIRLSTLCTAGGYRQSPPLPQIAPHRALVHRGRPNLRHRGRVFEGGNKAIRS